MIQMNKKFLIILVCSLLVIVTITIGILLKNNKETKTNTIEPYNPTNLDPKEDDEITQRIAECNYNNEQLTLLIPSTWQFEIVENDNETNSGMVVNSNYGIKFYPDAKNKDKNAVIYNQKEKLGVCGTGLKTEKIATESGIEAEVGYFNSGNNWNYVAFMYDGVALVAYNNGLEDEIAKEALEILKTMNFTDNTNIVMTIKEGTLTKTSATIIMQSKDKSKKYTTGAWFAIEKKENGVWKELPVSSLVSWIEIAYISNDEGIIEMGVNWKDIYGELEPGQYRIVKELTHNVYVYAEFSIEIE